LLGESIKDVRTKSRKIAPPCPHWLNPLPSCLCGHTINFENPKFFCAKNCGRPHLKNLSCPKNVRTGQTPLDCERLLWTTPNFTYYTVQGMLFVQAKGFEITYLSKVPEVKDTVHKQSLLQHLTQFVSEKFSDSTDFYSELGALTRCSRVCFAIVSANIPIIG